MTARTLVGSVFVTTSLVGFHRWPDAPAEVLYLRDRHRHLFKIRVDVSVEHKDRAIEYHRLKRQLNELFMVGTGYINATMNQYGEIDLGPQSCEVFATEIMGWLRAVAYPDRPYYRVEVSEDGENGSVVEATS